MRRRHRSLALIGVVGVALAVPLGVWGTAAGPTTTTTVAAPSTTTAPTTSTTAVPTSPGALVCATRLVSTWSVARLSSEVVAVSVNAGQIGSMGPAAHAGFGALLVFGTQAPAAFAPVVARLQGVTPGHLAMLVMTDEEGGGVSRLTNLVAPPPWARTMGLHWSAARIRAEGRRVGTAMLAVGLNVDLAPVADVDPRAVYPGPADPDGLRSFSGQPAVVSADAVAFAQGLAEAGVTSVVKHFPGLGGATGNTDDGPASTEPWAVLRRGALDPFARAVAADVPAVMVANARVPGLSPGPASLSPAVYAYLRGPLGFTGLLMTDSLGAGAISATGLSIPAASVEALRAGADLVLAGSPGPGAAATTLARQTAAAIAGAVASHTLTRAALEGAAAQVLATRNDLTC